MKMKKMKKRNHNFKENAYFIRKLILSVVFMAFILLFSAYNWSENFKDLEEELHEFANRIVEGKSNLRAEIANLEITLEENLTDRMKFIEYFAFVQKALDKKEINNFFKTFKIGTPAVPEGSLSSLYFIFELII